MGLGRQKKKKAEISAEEGCSWELGGEGGIGIRMLIRERRNHLLVPAVLQTVLRILGEPVSSSVNRSNNSPLPHPAFVGLNPLMFVECLDIRVMGVL